LQLKVGAAFSIDCCHDSVIGVAIAAFVI